jgi:hypothetical protein
VTSIQNRRQAAFAPFENGGVTRPPPGKLAIVDGIQTAIMISKPLNDVERSKDSAEAETIV